MNASRLYLIIGLVLVAVIVIVILLPDDDVAEQQTAAQQDMPPGHPGMGEGMGTEEQPGSSNVRSEFMDEYNRLSKKVDAQDASDTSDVLVYARMLLDAHQAAKALPLFERYIAAAPKNTVVMLDLSVAYFETKKPEKAEEITRKVLTIDPENTTAMYNLGALYADRKENDKAKKIWNTLISKYPDSPDAARAKQFLENL
jgi:tetratricopeptide (TPR) repeat protein